MTRFIEADDFLNNKVLTGLVLNQKENLAVYGVNTPDIEKNNKRKELFMLDLSSKESSKIDIDFQVDGYFFYDELLILKLLSGEETTLYSFDLHIGSLKKIVTLPFLLKEARIFNNSIYFLADIQKDYKKGDVIFSRKCPFYKEGAGVMGETVAVLFESSMDGKVINMISSSDMDIDKIDFDFKNMRIAFTAFKALSLKPVDSDVYTYDIEKEMLNVYTNGGYRIGFLKSMDDGKIIFTGTDLEKNSRNDIQQLYVIDLARENFEMLGDPLELSNEESSVITDSRFSLSSPVSKYKNNFFHVRNGRFGEILCKTDMKGKTVKIETGLSTIDSYAVGSKEILAIGLDGLALHEIYSVRESEEGFLREKLTEHNLWTENITLSKPRKITVESDAVEIDGYVYLPTEFDENKKYPGILLIHGGPKMMYSDVFSHDIQRLCREGYFVFCSNPRGSDGRGDEFSNIRAVFGSIPYRDLMNFTDEVIKIYPQLDENRLGLTGGSYGGYMTNFIITETERFKCAVSERGISNMMTAFTSSDIGYKFVYEYMGNKDTFWTNPESYMKASPIMRANKVKTPTLFIHGKDDYRCHYTESLNMYGALNYLGVDTAICLFEGENHSLAGGGKPKSRKRRYDEILNWFNKFLKEEHFNGVN